MSNTTVCQTAAFVAQSTDGGTRLGMYKRSVDAGASQATTVLTAGNANVAHCDPCLVATYKGKTYGVAEGNNGLSGTASGKTCNAGQCQ